MEIINEAQKLLKADGSPQWQDGYPTADIFREDIQKEECYVLIVDDQIAGVVTLAHDPQENYTKITEGQWNDEQHLYATIHRIAISTEFRGMHLGSYFMSNLITLGVEHGMQNFRIDTHQMNKRMQSLIKANGFQYRGLINKGDLEQERLCYELNIK